MKRVFSYILPVFALAMLAVVAYSPDKTEARSFNEGIEYGVIEPPLSTQAEDGKVEVMEVFWYGCPHCYSLEPTMEKYVEQKPDNVTFTRVPAMISPNWAYHGTLFYVGQMLDPDGSKEVHKKIFEAIHKQRRRISNDDQLRRFYQSLGFEAAEINNALNSMELQSKLAYAREISAKSGMDSVPTVIVNGKYITSPSMVSGPQGMIDIMNYLAKLEE